MHAESYGDGMTLAIVWARTVESPTLHAELSDTERSRLAGMRSQREVTSFVAGRALLRSAAARWMGVTAREVQLTAVCRDCGAEHGRPVIRADRPVPHVSLSRTADIVVVALSDNGPVGVDVERPDAPSFPGVAVTLLHPHESAATPAEIAQVWVRKESLLKATGQGLRVDPRDRVDQRRRIPPLIEWRARPHADVQLYDVDLGQRVRRPAVTLLARRRPISKVRRVELEATPATTMQ